MSDRYYLDRVDRWGLVIRDSKQQVTNTVVAKGEAPRISDKIVAAHVDTGFASIIINALNIKEADHE